MRRTGIAHMHICRRRPPECTLQTDAQAACKQLTRPSIGGNTRVTAVGKTSSLFWHLAGVDAGQMVRPAKRGARRRACAARRAQLRAACLRLNRQHLTM
jgi:hypothetical protein